jgi:hypothetical protein
VRQLVIVSANEQPRGEVRYCRAYVSCYCYHENNTKIHALNTDSWGSVQRRWLPLLRHIYNQTGVRRSHKDSDDDADNRWDYVIHCLLYQLALTSLLMSRSWIIFSRNPRLTRHVQRKMMLHLSAPHTRRRYHHMQHTVRRVTMQDHLLKHGISPYRCDS